MPSLVTTNCFQALIGPLLYERQLVEPLDFALRLSAGGAFLLPKPSQGGSEYEIQNYNLVIHK